VSTKASERSCDIEALDISRGEIAEAQLDTFISRRAEKNGAARAEEMVWKSGVKRHNARRRKEARAAWFAHFCRMAENHARISEDYERRAEELCKEGAA
jgi:cobyric acid synthase